ncbi:transforming growth factor-beta-induced protein ig-h3-like [Saccoglossus kowalevskii]|uniref:Stabilin-2-like n=1 Tax=Saccoglossus kowalevskii TaxID=10224 RepID=A0ABM0GT09_SACKO|nr:PREDICTED: stabilin-2-like [Saccoglossus kowalevskii]
MVDLFQVILLLANLLFGVFDVPSTDIGYEETSSNIYQTAVTLGATEFVKLVDRSTWVKDQLQHGSNYTVFIPDNEAFETMSKAAKEAIKFDTVAEWVLKYHMGIGHLTARDYKNDLRLPSSFKPTGYGLQSLRINIYEAFKGGHRKVYSVSGATIFRPDYECSNGIAHIIKKVIFPLPTGNNIAEFFEKDPRFSLLNMFIKKANLTATLTTDPNHALTVFAPNDDAIQKLTDEQKKKLVNTTYLNETLKTHVVGDAFYAASFYDFKSFTALTGETLILEQGRGGTTVQDKLIESFDVTLTNGVVHGMSEMFFPGYSVQT